MFSELFNSSEVWNYVEPLIHLTTGACHNDCENWVSSIQPVKLVFHCYLHLCLYIIQCTVLFIFLL